MTRLVELDYRPDSAALFHHYAAVPWSVFLDSGHPRLNSGRYDILAADPIMRLSTQGRITRIEKNGRVEHSEEPPLSLLRREWQHYARERPMLADLPFSGGLIGCLGYEFGRFTEPVPDHRPPDDILLPDMAVGLYEWCVVVDHHQRRSWLVGHTADEADWQRLRDHFSESFDDKPVEKPSGFGAVRAYTDAEAYAASFDRVQQHIVEGDCYQVNLAVAFNMPYDGDSWALYRYLRSVNPAPYSAFLNLPDGAVLCCSPESFLECRSGQVTTRPIKGTRPRASPGYEDMALAEELLHSDKDRAENIMIVDLLRNDLGRSCRPGSISVPALCRLRSYASVHHLISTVRGRLSPGCDALDLMQGCFPGGSVTGAPKRRAMEIIAALEPRRRSIYCGSLFYLDGRGEMDSNIAIRTMVHKDQHLYFWGGGGLVADSLPASEYQELHDKIAPFLKLSPTGALPTDRLNRRASR